MLRAPLAILILTLGALAQVGCASGAKIAADGLGERRPGDFTLGVAVLGPAEGVRRPGQTPSRYVVGADGWLRTAVGPGSRESVFPVRTRYLSGVDRDRLWEMVRASGIDGIEPPLRIQSPESFHAPAGRRVYLVQLTADGSRTSVAVPEGEPETEPFAAIADRLAEWSWVQP